jgi:tetratricopeptide (TPR) repeat protein
LARSLGELATLWSALGRGQEALAAAKESVRICRQLAGSSPDGYLPELAAALSRLATVLQGMGKKEQALGAAGEAVDAYRKVAESCPDAFQPDLAAALRARSLCLCGLERLEEALADLHEAIRLLTPYFRDIPNAHIRLMGGLLTDCLAVSKALGREPDNSVLGPSLEVLARLRSERPQ